jgi:hypothetical protein
MSAHHHYKENKNIFDSNVFLNLFPYFWKFDNQYYHSEEDYEAAKGNVVLWKKVTFSRSGVTSFPTKSLDKESLVA